MDAALKQALLELDCASLADADKSMRVMDAGLRPINSGAKLLGVARTVRCHEDFLAVIRALDASQPVQVWRGRISTPELRNRTSHARSNGDDLKLLGNTRPLEPINVSWPRPSHQEMRFAGGKAVIASLMGTQSDP